MKRARAAAVFLTEAEDIFMRDCLADRGNGAFAASRDMHLLPKPRRKRGLRSFDQVMRLMTSVILAHPDPASLTNLQTYHEVLARLFEEHSQGGIHLQLIDFIREDRATQAELWLRVVHALGGMVTLDIEEDVAISLMLTDVPESMRKVELPWSSFQLNLPKGVFKDTYGRSIQFVVVAPDELGEHIAVSYALSDSTRYAQPVVLPFKDLFDSENQADRCLGLLLAGLTFLTEQDPNLFQKREVKRSGRKKPKQKTKRQKREVEEPAPQVYYANPQGIWGDDLKANREYLEAKMEGRTYQKPRWFRRGHWRHQRVGKNKAETRLVRVSPTWCHRHEQEAS